MTANYNAGERTCLAEFILQLKQDKVFDEDHLKIYEEFILKFHKFLNGGLFKEMYIRDKAVYLENHSRCLSLSDANINLVYYDSSDDKEVVKVQDER
jgi:hypothetical protein